MPSFAYTARDKSGQPLSGTVLANSLQDAIAGLRNEGKYPIQVTSADEAQKTETAVARGIRISRADVIQLSTQLAIMVETGVTLTDALDCIGRQADRAPVIAIVTDLSQQLEAGLSLSDAMAQHPRSFPVLFVGLIRAAEKSGQLPRLLNRAVAYLRDERETLRRVKGALTYPTIMFLFACTTTIFLLTFVLPRFTGIYAAKKAALPAPTQFLMNASDFLINNWPQILIALAITIVSSAFYLRTAGGKRLWHYVQLNVPLLGKLYRKLHLARGLRMVGTMAGAGVPLMDCVTTAQSLCENSYFKDLWKQAQDQISVGRQLSEPLFGSALVPRSVAQMLSSGEKSGKLAQVMEQVSAYAEQELKEQIAAMTRYIEPIMIIAMGAIIGGVALALLLPVFTISKVMAH